MTRYSILIAILVLTCNYMSSECVSTTDAKKTFILSSNHSIPIIGFGSHGKNGEEFENILTSAIDIGLRHIDGGFMYYNDKSIGRALKKWFDKGGKREDIFITSKLPYIDNHAESVEKYLKLTLEKLGLQYIDLYLIHTPFGIHHKNGSYDVAVDKDGKVLLDYDIDHIAIWKEMEKQVEAGWVKSIGLSNFNKTQISKILKVAKIKPSSLQVEVQLYHQQRGLRDFCRDNGILVTAYAPLGSSSTRRSLRPEQKPEDFPNPLELQVVRDIAQNHGKTPVQVLLRHLVQGGTVVIPSSKKLQHIKENLEVVNFELTDDEMKKLDALDKGEEGKIFNYKFYKGIEAHPEYPFHGLN